MRSDEEHDLRSPDAGEDPEVDPTKRFPPAPERAFIAPEPETVVAPVASAADADSLETFIATSLAIDVTASRGSAPSAPLFPMLLERVEPSLGRGERIRLDASQWKVRIGRAEENDIRLYTASASREHAIIAANEAGEWVLTPCEGKSVLIDGDDTSEPVVLEIGMNLVLGRDHLRCVFEGLGRNEMAAQTAIDGFQGTERGLPAKLRRIGATGWMIALIALLCVGLISLVWLRG